MIEFNGSYFQYSTSKALPVLVQFDGAELIVWHVPEPFFRLAAFNKFRVYVSKDMRQRSINLPNGARIDTSDHIVDSLHGNQSNPADRWYFKKPLAMVLLTLLTLSTFLVCCWALSSESGLLGL